MSAPDYSICIDRAFSTIVKCNKTPLTIRDISRFLDCDYTTARALVKALYKLEFLSRKGNGPPFLYSTTTKARCSLF